MAFLARIRQIRLRNVLGFFLAVAAFSVWLNPGLGFRGLYAVFCGGRPPASSWYTVRVENESTRELVVTLVSLTDRTDSTTSRSQKLQRVMAGWVPETEAVLGPGQSDTLSLPSESDERTAVFLLSARTDPDFSKIVDQYLFTTFLAPKDGGPLVNSRANRGAEASTELKTVRIQQSDLAHIDPHVDKAIDLVDKLHAAAKK